MSGDVYAGKKRKDCRTAGGNEEFTFLSSDSDGANIIGDDVIFV